MNVENILILAEAELDLDDGRNFTKAKQEVLVNISGTVFYLILNRC